MKKLTILAILATLIVSTAAIAQPVPVDQAATRASACTAANATAAVNNAVTLTLTPPSGYYVYLCGFDIAISQDGTATVNTNQSFTSTNLGGWAWKYSLPATANTQLTQSFYFNNPVKSAAAGTAVTVVSPAAKANSAFSINGYYYFAP